MLLTAALELTETLHVPKPTVGYSLGTQLTLLLQAEQPQSYHEAWREGRKEPSVAWPARGLAADGGHRWVLERVVSKGEKLGCQKRFLPV